MPSSSSSSHESQELRSHIRSGLQCSSSGRSARASRRNCTSSGGEMCTWSSTVRCMPGSSIASSPYTVPTGSSRLSTVSSGHQYSLMHGRREINSACHSASSPKMNATGSDVSVWITTLAQSSSAHTWARRRIRKWNGITVRVFSPRLAMRRGKSSGCTCIGVSASVSMRATVAALDMIGSRVATPDSLDSSLLAMTWPALSCQFRGAGCIRGKQVQMSHQVIFGHSHMPQQSQACACSELFSQSDGGYHRDTPCNRGQIA